SPVAAAARGRARRSLRAQSRAGRASCRVGFRSLQNRKSIEGIDKGRKSGVRCPPLGPSARRGDRMSLEVPNLSQSERMEEVLRLLETRDSVHVTELAETFAVSE